MAVALLGMRGSGSFTADERPQNWRQGILLIFPNGDAPLTGILSMCAEEPTDDPQFNWMEKGLPTQRGIVIGAAVTPNVQPADNATIAAANATTEVALSLKPDGGSNYDVAWLQPGYILFDENTDEAMVVTKVVTGGSGVSFVNVRRNLGPKFSGGAIPAITGNTATGDPVSVIGNANQEGAPVGASVSFQPIRQHNFTQIFRTPVSITRTAARTKLRYDRNGAWMEAKREGLQIHSLEIEKSLMFSEREEMVSFANAALPLTGGNNGISSANPMRTQRGMLNWLPAASTTLGTPSIHWDLGTANGGNVTEVFFDQWLEEVFRFGSAEKLCFAGSTALNVLNQLAKNKMTINAVPSDRMYGFQFNRYTTPFGDLLVKQHPLMSDNPTWRKDLMVIDTPYLRLRVMDDTTYLRNRQNPGDDARVDEWLTEAGLEVRFSGATADSAGGLQAIAGKSVHGRLKGISALAG